MTTETETLTRTPAQELAFQREGLEAANKVVTVADRAFHAAVDGKDYVKVAEAFKVLDKANSVVAKAIKAVEDAQYKVDNAAKIARQGAIDVVSLSLAPHLAGAPAGRYNLAPAEATIDFLQAMVKQGNRCRDLGIEGFIVIHPEGQADSLKPFGVGVYVPKNSRKATGTRVSGGKRGLWSKAAEEKGISVGGASAHAIIARKDSALHAAIHAANPNEPCPYA